MPSNRGADANVIVRPDIYDELVETRRKLREAEGRSGALLAENMDLESRLNVATARALAWEMSRGPSWLEIKMRLDPALLAYAKAPREAFNCAAESAILNLWAEYRKRFNPITPEAPDAAE